MAFEKTPRFDKFLDKFLNKNNSTIAQIFYTVYGRLCISAFFIILFGSLTNVWDFANYLHIASWIYPIYIGLKMCLYAWILNPIRLHKENKKWKNNKKRLLKLVESDELFLTIKYPEDTEDQFYIKWAIDKKANHKEWDSIYSLDGYLFKDLKIDYTPFDRIHPVTEITILYSEVKKTN
jgi:hypothetical protein